jgi:hypothetical protein
VSCQIIVSIVNFILVINRLISSRFSVGGLEVAIRYIYPTAILYVIFDVPHREPLTKLLILISKAHTSATKAGRLLSYLPSAWVYKSAKPTASC